MTEEYYIPFTQYIPPDAKTQKVYYTTKDPDIAEAAETAISKGVYFECEILSTGKVAFYAYHERENMEDYLISMKLSENNPKVIDNLHQMIRECKSYLVSQGIYA